ncbi:MAG: ParB-like nuclease domain-containing protein [Oscillospiraceae bacterium]|nr:ParB-like nuclease domain-containing protein [Oscillospiraceae bacterium]
MKTGILLRLLTKKADCDELHPNPEDEFCMPEVGPNYKIISEYQQQFLDNIRFSQPYFSGEPIIVERLHPNGYRIVNGHHRWAAALCLGQPSIPIQIVNLTHTEDVKRILENSTHTKRVAIDLDEVIFRPREEANLERPIPLAWNKLYQQRIRLGVPALFHFLSKNGYDIWLYSAQYYSTDSVQRFFRKYHVKVDGVITAIGKRQKNSGNDGKKLEKMISDKYQYTVHIDNDSALMILAGRKEFRDFTLDGEASDWSRKVMDVIETIEKENTDDGQKT